jgi:hypothetical protein
MAALNVYLVGEAVTVAQGRFLGRETEMRNQTGNESLQHISYRAGCGCALLDEWLIPRQAAKGDALGRPERVTRWWGSFSIFLS